MKIGDTEVFVIKGDITQVDTEAIVNAANNKFLMGGGVAGAIKRKGGRLIEDEAVKQGPVEVGEAVLTGAGALPAKHVIHAATMAMDFKTDEGIIRQAAGSALSCAQKNNISSLAFCALGCGVGGFSYVAAAKIMAQEVFRYLRETPAPSLKRIVFVLSSPEAYEVFNKNVAGYLDHISNRLCQGPFITVDGLIHYQGGVVLIERSNPPFGWALPGGFVDYGESLEQAVAREVQEETHLKFVGFRQFRVYSAPGRDPRFHTISAVFIGTGEGRLKADSDAQAAAVFKLDALPEKIAFDHRQIIEEGFKK